MVENYKKNLVDYFKKNLKKGYTTDALKWALINQGYSRINIEQAIEQANKELAEKYEGMAKELDPFHSFASAKPGRAIYSPPDVVVHDQGYYLSPF